MPDYIITPEADEDIDEILRYIAEDNLEAAVAFSDRLTNLFGLLAANKKIGRERPEIEQKLHSFPLGNYLVFYREWAGKIAIVRVLHGARDLDEIFG